MEESKSEVQAATAAAVKSDAKPEATAKPKLSMLRRLRPRRWREKPAVPAQRGMSPEYGAGFLSRLTFQWINGLMMVSR